MMRANRRAFLYFLIYITLRFQLISKWKIEWGKSGRRKWKVKVPSSTSLVIHII